MDRQFPVREAAIPIPLPLSSRLVLILVFLFSLALEGCGHAPPSATVEGRGVLGPTSTVGAVSSVEVPLETATVDQVDVYHGVEVRDPYRWLEDLDSPETRAWIEAQNRRTSAYLAAIPGRERIRARLTRLWDHERWSVPFRRGGRYFYFHNDGLSNQSVLCVQESLEAPPRVLLDPNQLSPDGTIAVSGIEPSEDGNLLAYGLSTAGSDWQEWRVREVATGRDREDRLRWLKFSGVSWLPDASGFFYSRYDEPREGQALQGVNFDQKLFFHAIGRPQSEDRLVYARPDRKEWSFDGRVTDDGRYLIITVREGTDPRNRVYYKGLGREDTPIVELLDAFDASWDFIASDGPIFWFLTDRDAPRGRILAIDTSAPERRNWREVLPQGRSTLVGASVVGESLLASYLDDAHSRIAIHSLDGRARGDLPLSGLGTAGGFTGRRGDRETFYSFVGFTKPSTIYRHDFETGRSEVFRAPRVDFASEDYETRQVFATSKDGTRIPIFLTHRRGLAPDGARPTLLYGYGGFRISITPAFSAAVATWLEMGGVYAVATIRGGGEYGEEWHQAGTRLRKQNVFDDFIAAAEWLTASGVTRPARLAIQGGSNGGLLVGACMTQRPELFGAALPAVGVLDMLRFHQFTIGWAWKSDFGSVDDPDEFRALLGYSPYHRLREGIRYPATLITTADHDDRVVPSHSFKFAAALQAAQEGDAPILIRIETRAGHGAGKPTSKAIDEAADRLTFLSRVFEIELPSAGGSETPPDAR